MHLCHIVLASPYSCTRTLVLSKLQPLVFFASPAFKNILPKSLRRKSGYGDFCFDEECPGLFPLLVHAGAMIKLQPIFSLSVWIAGPGVCGRLGTLQRRKCTVAYTTPRQAWPAPWYKAAGSRSSWCLTSCSAQTQRLKTIVTPGLAVLPPSQRSVGNGPRQCNGLGLLPTPAPAPLPWPAFSYPTLYTIYPFFVGGGFSLLSSFRLWFLPARHAPAAAG